MLVAPTSCILNRRTADIDRPAAWNGKQPAILFLLNPGNFTRHCLLDMVDAAKSLGFHPLTIELGEVWTLNQGNSSWDLAGLAGLLRDANVKAVISSSMNGLLEWPCASAPDGRPQPFFEQLGIPHLMWWTDHPQWANNRMGLRPDLQAALRSPNNHHFVKSEAAASELHDVLGWPNCHGVPVAENAERLRPVADARPDHDVVALVGSPPHMDPALQRFLTEDDPDFAAIQETVADKVLEQLSTLWASRAPRSIITELTEFGRRWATARQMQPLTASWRVFGGLEPEHPAAAKWLRSNPDSYFEAISILWEFGRWRRTFYICYLAKYFRLGIFGADWSSVGLDGASWVQHDDQPAFYARGRVAINISQAGEEEGVAHKPFQIAASGVPMAHIDAAGLEDLFQRDREVAVFLTPREAREAIDALLQDPDRRAAMASAARQRLCRDHTWRQRLPEMLRFAGTGLPR